MQHNETSILKKSSNCFVDKGNWGQVDDVKHSSLIYVAFINISNIVTIQLKREHVYFLSR